MSEKSKGWADRVWDMFSSMKMALILLGATAMGAGIGTFFPQAEASPEEAEAVSQVWQALGFTHVYSTVWFRLLVGLLCVNLVVCSIQRFSGTYNRTFRPRPPQNSREVPAKLQQILTGQPEVLRAQVAKVLKERGFKLTDLTDRSTWSFVAQQRRLGYWGAFLVHIGFVVLVLGALLGVFFGFKGQVMAAAGTTIPIQNINVTKGRVADAFSLRVNSAEDRFLPNGERDNWYSDLSILENDQEVARQTISVNHPFTYKGVTFYQSSFAHGVRLTVDQKGQKSTVFIQNQGRPYKAPGTDLYFFVAQMAGNPQQPRILFEVYQGGQAQPLQTDQLKVGETADIEGQYKITLDGYNPFTGLQVKKDPGVNVVWLGCAILLIGLGLSFYWRPLLVTGCLEEVAGQARLTIGMVSGRMQGRAREDFAALTKQLGEGV